MKKVAVIGAGTMGHCIAMIFAQAGCQVELNDTSDEALERAKGLILANLETQAQAGLFDLDQRSSVLGRIHCTTDLDKAAADAELVLEAVFERADIKEEIFKRLDKAAPPGAILASNTSYLDIYKFVKTGRPDKVIIAHWFAPPPYRPLGGDRARTRNVRGNHNRHQGHPGKTGQGNHSVEKIFARLYH